MPSTPRWGGSKPVDERTNINMKPKLKHIGLSLLAGTAALLCTTSPARAADKKPDILVIWGDDIGTWNVGAYTHGMMQRIAG